MPNLPIIPEDNPVHFLLENIELLAELQHEIWAHWMDYLFSICTDNPDGSVTIPFELVTRWKRQIVTDYSDLSEKEKNSDREQAIHIISGFIRDS